MQVKSPNGQLWANVWVRDGVVHYTVQRAGRMLIGDSQLALETQPRLGRLAVVDATTRPIVESYTLPVGKKSLVSVRGNELTMHTRDEAGHALDVQFRAFDDGVAFRYVAPEAMSIIAEHSQFTLADTPLVYAQPTGFASAYEDTYVVSKTPPADKVIALPLLARWDDGLLMGITEAGLVDYPNAYLSPLQAASATLETVLAPGGARGVMRTPWRTMMIGGPRELIESNLVTTLAPPRCFNADWVKPGKVQFAWWNGYVTPPPIKGGVNEASLKYYIDFCAANGIEYASIDGYEFDVAWYGGKVLPYAGADVTKPIPELNLPEVMRYARERGVKIRIWLHCEGLTESNMEHVLSTYAAWGASGIMVDFMGRDDQIGVRYQRHIVETAAKHKLTVAFHGIAKPTGLTRTYPNLVTFEGVRGLEYDKWDKGGVTPEHEIREAYVRMLAGPMDTHQGAFRMVPAAKFTPRSIAPNAIGTLARTLATYVVYENHSPMLADYPQAYLDEPQAFDFVKRVPSTWDDTKFLAGEVASYISIARRKGDAWFVGTMTDSKARALTLPLSFLGEGRYLLEIHSDQGVSARVVTRRDVVAIDLAPAGGHAMRLSPEHQNQPAN